MKRALRWVCAALLITGFLYGCSGAQSRKASYIAHGKVLLASGDYDKARVEFRNAAQIDPTDIEARLLLGQVAEKLGDARGALGQYLAAVAADPHAVAPRAALARVYLYGGLPDKAIELIGPQLAAAPDNAQLLTVRGAAREQLGDAAGALADAQRAMRLAPEDLYAIGLLASVYQARAQFDQAIAVVNGGLAKYPGNPDLHALLAELDLANQEPAKAEGELRRIVALEPDVLVHRYRLAQFYLQRKDGAGAERTLREAVARHPESVEAKLQLVECLAQQEGTGAAAQQVDRFLAAEPGNDPLRLSLGQFLAQNKQPVAAERIFRAVIAQAGNGPDGLAARDRLAALLIDRQDLTGAAALIAQVLAQNVRDNDALILRSRIGLAQGQTRRQSPTCVPSCATNRTRSP
jgi:predicted Zn-dependent protease